MKSQKTTRAAERSSGAAGEEAAPDRAAMSGEATQPPGPPPIPEGLKEEWTALVAADQGLPFGPLFFLQHLRGLIRDRCPEPGEGQPTVEFHLADGEVLNVCHVMGIAPNWIALAVSEVDRPMGSATMRTELLPYATIARVTIRSLPRDGGHHIGFDTGRKPSVLRRMAAEHELSPEEALRAMENPPAPVPQRRPAAAGRGRVTPGKTR